MKRFWVEMLTWFNIPTGGIMGLLAGLLMAAVLWLAVVHADSVLLGDATGDGEVNMGDVVKEERCIIGLDSDCAPGADADADGDIDMGDVLTTEWIIMAQP